MEELAPLPPDLRPASLQIKREIAGNSGKKPIFAVRNNPRWSVPDRLRDFSSVGLERLLHTQEVSSSNLLSPTPDMGRLQRCKRLFFL